MLPLVFAVSASGLFLQSHSPAVPLVSVLTPVRDAVTYLEAAIQSVLAQSPEIEWELLLIDDGSTDGSFELGQHYARCFPGCIRLLHHPDHRNCGTSATRNLGLRHARGSLIAFLDADDVWLPGMLSTQVALLSRFPAAAMVYGNAERTWEMDLPCTPHGQPCGVNELPALLPSGTRPGLLPAGCPLQWFLADETLTPCTCTVVVRASVARAVGGFVESFDGLYDDQAFYAKVLLQGRAAVTLDCVARYRRHYTSCCARTWHNHALQIQARQAFQVWLAAYRQSLSLGIDSVGAQQLK